MSMPRHAYSSTVVSAGQVVAAVAGGVALSAVLLAIVPASPAAWLLPGLAIILTGFYLGTVRLLVGAERLALGFGPWGRPGRIIPVSLVADARAEGVSWAQVYGIGVPWHWRTTRMTVRSGPALVLTLTTGECIRISTADPPAAIALLQPPALVSQPGDRA